MSLATTMSTGRLWSAYFREMRCEFLKSWRTPAFAVPTLVFPVMFYVLFGIFLGSMRGNADQALITFANFGVFGAMGPGLFGFGVSLAIEREQGLLTLKQALPQPAGAYLLARAFMAMLFVAAISVLLTTMAVTLGKVPLTSGQIVQLFFIDTLGALPFCAIGMYLGSLVSGQASPAIINCVFLPMAFLSGLFIPLQFMPAFLQKVAPVFPAYHQSQLALATLGRGNADNFAMHVAVLAGVTVVFFLLAVKRMHGSGFRLLGARPARAVGLAAVAAAALVALSFSGVFGGKPAKTEDANAATDAASAATDTPAPSNEGPPPGVPAPAEGVIASFDGGSAQAPYGIGIQAAGDDFQGGKSTASQRLVDDGANGSKGALEITGEVRPGTQYPSAGAFFFPEGPPTQGLMDYSKKKTLSFHARGDGKQYTVLVLSGTPARMPPLMLGFTAGPEWQKHEFQIADLGAADWQRVRLIGWMQTAQGTFQFQLDDIRLE
jgi:ABC-2 type transport system permease protein